MRTPTAAEAAATAAMSGIDGVGRPSCSGARPIQRSVQAADRHGRRRAVPRLESIAERAGVAVQTVYFNFHNKRTVLKEVTDQLATGDDDAVALLERPWVEHMRAASDAAAAVAVWCSLSAEVFGRVARIRWMAVTASANDADLAAQERVNREQTLAGHRVLAEHLAERGALRADLSVEQAGEILYALVSLELYVLFTTELRWSPWRWEEWVLDTVVRTVLAGEGHG